MALFRTISRISLVVSAALGAWRLWKSWRQRDQGPAPSATAVEV